MSKLKALLFDCDGVLAETERDGHRVGYNAAMIFPYQVLAPVMVLAILMLGFNLFGDGLRDALGLRRGRVLRPRRPEPRGDAH